MKITKVSMYGVKYQGRFYYSPAMYGLRCRVFVSPVEGDASKLVVRDAQTEEEICIAECIDA